MLSSRLTGLFFFFQAEDGIRDLTVTGVQTCALPILRYRYENLFLVFLGSFNFRNFRFVMNELELAVTSESRYFRVNKNFNAETEVRNQIENKIGRASCRERV